MKILFIGEGLHDVGLSDHALNQPRTAVGTVQTLARKVAPRIDAKTSALRWVDLPRFNKKGLSAKVAAAIVLSDRNGFDGTVFIYDRDKVSGRLEMMTQGTAAVADLVPSNHKTACGVAVESIEAWTLAAPTALAAELGKSPNEITDVCHPHRAEELYEQSEKEEKRPKALLARIAKLAHREADTIFRIAVAEKTDIEELKRHCPQGFKPFAEAVADAFT